MPGPRRRIRIIHHPLHRQVEYNFQPDWSESDGFANEEYVYGDLNGDYQAFIEKMLTASSDIDDPQQMAVIYETTGSALQSLIDANIGAIAVIPTSPSEANPTQTSCCEAELTGGQIEGFVGLADLTP